MPVIESTWQWLVDHQPAEEGEVVLSWGDSRIGNIIWDDFRAAAVLDWEMASLGQPEMDLGWYLYFDRQFTEPLGVPRPAGFGSHEETIERYAELMGRPMRDLFFYEVFSGFRFAVVMFRLSDLVFGSDIAAMDEEPTWRRTTSPPSSWPRCSTWSRRRLRLGSSRRSGHAAGRSDRDPGRPQAVCPASRHRRSLCMASCQPSRIRCSSSTVAILAMTCTVILSS